MRTKFGVLIPNNFMGESPSTTALVDFIREAETIGFESLWVLERLNHEGTMLDPLLTLTIAATITKNPRLGTAVLLFPLHDPVLLAKAVSTLDFISNGRLILGLGLGSREDEFLAVGHEIKDRVRRFSEGLTVMKKLWSGNNVSLKTEFRELRNVSISPKPIQKPHPPILIGGSSEMALKRAAILGDGYIAGTGTGYPDRFAKSWSAVREYAREAGRDVGNLESVALTYCVVDSDRERARKLAEHWVSWYHKRIPHWAKTEIAYQTIGTVSDCVANVEAFVEAGVNTVVLCPITPDLKQLRRYQEIVESFW